MEEIIINNNEDELELITQKLLYLSTSEPKIRTREVDSLGRSRATGKRKSSVAVVILKDGTGRIKVNGKDLKEYFPMEVNIKEVCQPFAISGTSFDIVSKVYGGGTTGQAGALCLAISKALLKFNPLLYISLRKAGLLTPDIRRVERKKIGRKKARTGMPTSRR